MQCPNYMICNGEDNKHNGVCYLCDNSIIGYSNKRTELSHKRRPTVLSSPRTSNENIKRISDKSDIKRFKNNLEKNRLTTGILKFKENIDNCPICLKDKNLFVVHPTCKHHCICTECFKNTFLDKKLDEPDEPDCFGYFYDFLEENSEYDISTLEETPPNHCPEDIKNIYSICSNYCKNLLNYYEEEEKLHKNRENLRKCPECRATDLSI